MLATTLAIIALVVSVASLAWQVVTWRTSGPVVRVRKTYMRYYHQVSDEKSGVTFAVIVTNVGRAPITVNEVRLEFDSPIGRWFDLVWLQKLVPPQDAAYLSTPLPFRLEPASDATFEIKFEAPESFFVQLLNEKEPPLNAVVVLGNGRKISVPIPQGLELWTYFGHPPSG